jgi:hypothetical protein
MPSPGAAGKINVQILLNYPKRNDVSRRRSEGDHDLCPKDSCGTFKHLGGSVVYVSSLRDLKIGGGAF